MTRLISRIAAVFLFSSLVSSAAVAMVVEMAVVPTGWKLENNIGNRPEIWYSGSTCVNGRLTFPINATTEDKNRFWATITAAKIANRKIFVYYENASSGCELYSFGFPSE